MKQWRTITTGDVRRWRERRADGWTWKEIGDADGRHKDVVAYSCNRAPRGKRPDPQPLEPVPHDSGRRWRLRLARTSNEREAFAHALAEALAEGLPEQWRRKALRML